MIQGIVMYSKAQNTKFCLNANTSSIKTFKACWAGLQTGCVYIYHEVNRFFKLIFIQFNYGISSEIKSQSLLFLA